MEQPEMTWERNRRFAFAAMKVRFETEAVEYARRHPIETNRKRMLAFASWTVFIRITRMTARQQTPSGTNPFEIVNTTVH